MSGFTFLELLIVVLVLGIVATLGIPALLSSLDDAQLDAAASELSTALRYAQLVAAGTGRATRVTIYATVDTLLVEQMTHTNLSDILNPANTELDATDVETTDILGSVVHPTIRVAPYQVSLADARFGGVDIVSASFGGGPSVDFSGSGAPSSAGTVLLALGGRQVTVSIDDLAGHVTISE